MVALKKDLVMTDPRRCSKCGADVEETYTERICQGCGDQELNCECEKAE